MVILYTFPYTTNGVTTSGGTDTDGVATLSASLSAVVKAVPSSAQIPITGVYKYPTLISDATLASAAINFKVNGASTTYVAAAFVTLADGRKHFEFYVDQASWALHPVIFANAWLEWVSNGLFVGSRRITLNPHIDDIFMNTGMWDLELQDEGTITYRITPNDLQSILNWQNALNTRLPAGSRVVLTFPYNGATVIENGGYTSDALFVKAKTIRDNFYWESHTFTHPELDTMTYAEVTSEFTQNLATANSLFNNNLNSPYYCPKSCITPSISGLFNGEALRAMYDFGIRNVVGDNTRPELTPSNVFHGITTTVATHGFAGMYIVPRHATNIYYDASTPDDLTSQYNFRYNSYWGRDLTIDELMAEEVKRDSAHLLAYRQDPFMFHQANMRFYTHNGASTSLLTSWVDGLATTLLKYTTLPVLSCNHDDLAQKFKDREARDACGVSGKLKINSGTFKIEGMNITATGSCKFAVTGATSTSSGVTMETYGPDKTMWLNLQANSAASVTFSTAVPLL